MPARVKLQTATPVSTGQGWFCEGTVVAYLGVRNGGCLLQCSGRRVFHELVGILEGHRGANGQQHPECP